MKHCQAFFTTRATGAAGDAAAMRAAPGVRTYLLSFAVVVPLLVLAGCGGRAAVCEPDPSYYGRKDGRALEVPDDLDVPQDSGRFSIPSIAQAQANRNVDPACTSYPPRIEGVAEQQEQNRRRRQRAQERDEAALAAATAAAEAAGGSASNPRVAPEPPEVAGEPLDRGSRRFAQVYDAVAAWAQAWEERSFEDYLAAYAEDFRPPRPMSRAQWEEVRLERMNEGARALTDMATLQVFDVEGGVVARVDQSFAFESIESTITKQLFMTRERREWRIVTEEVVTVQ